MSAGENDFHMEQGAAFNKTITWTDSDNVAIPITGYTVRFQAAIRQTSSEKVINLSTDDDEITITDGTNGVFQINIAGSVTAEYTFFNAVYLITAESDGGVVQRILEGEITLAREMPSG